MARLLWLVDVLRAAGLTVVEESGWRTRGDDSYGPVRGVIIHETRGSATSTDAAEIGVLINGRVGLSGPIAQLYLSRSGVWHVIASGTCHHVKTGWGGPFSGLGNTHLLGIEAQHAESEDWARKPAQYAAYVKGVAAILRHTGWPPPVGHKEHQPGDKPDPAFSMPAFRTAVAANQEGDDMNLTDTVRLNTNGGVNYSSPTTTVEGVLASTNLYVLLARNSAAAAFAELRSKLADQAVVLQTLADALRAGGSNIDTATILGRIDDRADQEAQRDAAHAAEVTELRAEIHRLTAALAAAGQAQAALGG